MNDITKVIDFLAKFLTFQNISFILGLIGSAGTVFNILNSRKRLICSVSKSVYRTDIQTLVLVVCFENRSRLPISVTNMTIDINGTEQDFEEYPRCVSYYRKQVGNETIDRNILYNLNFPVSLSQFGAVSGYLLFDISQEDFEKLPTQMNLKVHSTRWMVQKKRLKKLDIKLTSMSEIPHHQ